MTEPVVQQYIGTKIIKAEPFPAWKQSGEWGVGAQGYKVEYNDGYVSWSPKAQFEKAYRPTNGMNFGLAIEAMKKGLKVCRAGWNGKDMWLMLVPVDIAEKISFEYEALDAYPWIGMRTADIKFVPWPASQTDVLADDWMIVE